VRRPDILAAYDGKDRRVEETRRLRHGRRIDVTAATLGLDAMLAEFSSEHWHDEDEVRLISKAAVTFTLSADRRARFAVEVEAGDLIRGPARHPSLG